MKNIWLWVGIIVVLVGGYFAFYKNNTDTKLTNEPINIGAILILSGDGASAGENSKQGADLAVEEINAAGGINGRPIVMSYQDNPGDDTKSAVSALQNLINQDIKLVIGTNWTPSGLAIAPLACEKGAVVISPSLGVKEFNETCDYLFNVWPHDDVLSEKLGEWLYTKGYRRIAVLGSVQEWENQQAVAVKKGFEKAGGTLSIFEITQKDEKDFKTAAAKIKGANPDGVVFTNYTYEQLAARRLRELGVKVPFYSVLIDDDKIKNAAGAFEGAIAVTWFSPSSDFIAKFVAKYGEQPDLASDTSYDAVRLIAQAIEKTGSTDPKAVKDYLGKLTTYNGASGMLQFDGRRGVTKSSNFVVVKDGKAVPYKE
ncbi:MAG: ABC transporter substrate-binding protein [bacterium]|nr:ABC transporter substrate-binding protein [bacterium]